MAAEKVGAGVYCVSGMAWNARTVHELCLRGIWLGKYSLRLRASDSAADNKTALARLGPCSAHSISSRDDPSSVSAGKLRSENAISHDRHQLRVQLGSCVPFPHYGRPLFYSFIRYYPSVPCMSPKLESSIGKRHSLVSPRQIDPKLPRVS